MASSSETDNFWLVISKLRTRRNDGDGESSNAVFARVNLIGILCLIMTGQVVVRQSILGETALNVIFNPKRTL